MLGKLTSGCFSPLLKKGIGMGYVSSKWRKDGKKVVIDIRGKKHDAIVVKMPFVE